LHNEELSTLQFESKTIDHLRIIKRLIINNGFQLFALFRQECSFLFELSKDGQANREACREDYINEIIPFVIGSSNVSDTSVRS